VRLAVERQTLRWDTWSSGDLSSHITCVADEEERHESFREARELLDGPGDV